MVAGFMIGTTKALHADVRQALLRASPATPDLAAASIACAASAASDDPTRHAVATTDSDLHRMDRANAGLSGSRYGGAVRRRVELSRSAAGASGASEVSTFRSVSANLEHVIEGMVHDVFE